MKKKVCIIDYNAGNIMSLYQSITNVSNHEIVVSNDLKDVTNSDYIILPGVGSYSYVSSYLSNKKIDVALRTAMIDSQKPILGICLGMQILFENSEEYGLSQGLNLFKGNVKKIKDNSDYPLPNIGWREVQIVEGSQFNSGWYYFAHSYVVEGAISDNVIGVSNYGIDFPAVVKHHNFYGVQFHPEKSSKSGIDFLTTFLNI
jgi:glutamine amidotransferase